MAKFTSRKFFRQLFDAESYTYTYLLACARTREAVIIDPVDIQAQRDITLIKQLQLKLKYALNTHVHADHVTGSGILVNHLGCQSAISKASGAKANIHLEENQQIQYGDQSLEVRSTPGHTNGCLTFVDHANRQAFTGDALLIRACGRTDFQEGNPRTLFKSVHSKIFSLPGDYLLYPGHDYLGNTVTSVSEELEHNPRMLQGEDKFVAIMNNLGLTKPKKIDEAVPLNLMCGPSQLGKPVVRMDE